MSKASLEAARKFGEKLNTFENMKEAEDHFSAYRKDLLEEFERISASTGAFHPDYSIDSLVPLEKWYFSLYENDAFSKVGVTREDFEKMMGIYFGEVSVRSIDEASWTVQEFPFVRGKYEMYVNKDLMSLSAGGVCKNLCSRPGNKRQNLMSREFKKYFLPTKK